jgi:hypothetical protein
MFLFSWKKIYKISGGQVGTIYLIVKMLVEQQIPKNKYDRIYKYYNKDYTGQCFLVNPKALFDNAYKYDTKEVVQYIALASFRRYSEYLATNKTTLAFLESPVSKELIIKNRLLKLENDEIHFLYEKSS